MRANINPKSYAGESDIQCLKLNSQKKAKKKKVWQFDKRKSLV